MRRNERNRRHVDVPESAPLGIGGLMIVEVYQGETRRETYERREKSFSIRNGHRRLPVERFISCRWRGQVVVEGGGCWIINMSLWVCGCGCSGTSTVTYKYFFEGYFHLPEPTGCFRCVLFFYVSSSSSSSPCLKRKEQIFPLLVIRFI